MNLKNANGKAVADGNCNGTFCDAKQYILERMSTTIKNIESTSGISDTIDAILDADKIFVYGVGRSGMVGRSFAMRLVQLGLKCFFIGESTTPIVTSKDIVVIISRTGETYSAIQTANIVRRVGAGLIVVTGRKGSKLSHTGNIIHILPTPDDEKRQKLAPLGTLFEISALLFLDCLVAELMIRMGETEETMKARHAIWV